MNRLIRAAQFHVAVEHHRIVALRQRIQEFVHRNRRAVFQAFREIVAFQNAGHGILRAQADHVLELQLVEPLAIEADFGFARVQNFEDLSLVSLGVAIDIGARHRRPRDVAAGGVADHAGHIADQKNDGVTQILKVFHLAQQHGVAQVQIRSGGIESGFHAQRTAGLGGFGEARAQVFFTDDLREALFQIRELFGNGGKGHFTIVNMKALILMTFLISAAGAQSLTDRFFDEYYFPFNPTTATSSGIHKYDGQLEDYSKAGVDARVAKLKAVRGGVRQAPSDPDRDLVLSTIRAGLLEYQMVRSWERNPDIYSSGITGSAFTIMSRTFAPPEVRLRSLIERERKMPEVLAEARANLKNPPKIYTEIAIQQAPGIISFFEKDVPLAFKSVTDQKLLAEFHAANGAVIKALSDYQNYLKTDLLPRSNGDFRLGADNYAKKLLYEEMVDIPLDRLLEIGYADLHGNQEKFRETALLIDKTKTPQQILAEAVKDHPRPDQLLQTFRDTLGGLRDFIETHHR